MIPQELASKWRQYAFEHQEDMMRNHHLDFKIKLYSKDDARLDYALSPVRVSSHQFLPFIEFIDVTRRYKKKDDGTGDRESRDKDRPLCYAAHQDVLLYSWYARLLDYYYESYLAKKVFQSSVIAYRRIPNTKDVGEGKSNIHFAEEVFNTVREMGECTVLTFDVQEFFPSIDHGQLKEMWCALLEEGELPKDHHAIFRSLTKYSIIKKSDLLERFGTDTGKKEKKFMGLRKSRICSIQEFRSFRHTRISSLEGERKIIRQNLKIHGIPQGSSMSGLLSNIFMLDFDEAVHAEVLRYGGRYWRYSDDIAIVLPANVDQNHIDEFVRAESINKKLKLHGIEKSAKIKFAATQDGLISIGESLDYLGFSFNGKMILLRDKTVARFFRKMSNGVRKEVSRANKYKAKINIKKLYRRFTYLGLVSSKRKNFLSYAQNSAGIMKSDAIKTQLSHVASILHTKLEKRKRRYKRWKQIPSIDHPPYLEDNR
ncbi:hypothetical protein KBD61_03230 [Patescibacteria group bacterium]|nr:hypothetical protein [Patescibacteria group bacterium]